MMNTKTETLTDPLEYDEWLDLKSWELWTIFDLRGWSWYNTDNQPPTPEEIREKLSGLVNKLFNEKLNGIESGRIRVERHEDELQLLVDIDSFFADDTEPNVDVFEDWGA